MALIDNLISYWKLDESSGDAIDVHGDNDGTVYGATQGVNGKINTAYYFDGSDDYVDLGDPANLEIGTGDFSYSFWIKFTTSVSAFAFSSYQSSPLTICYINFDATNLGVIWYLNGDKIKAVCVHGCVVDQWYHIVVVCDRDTSNYIYINGTLKDLTTNLKDDGANDFDIVADKYFFRYGASIYSKGSLDEFGFWNRVLTSDEVTALYNGGNGLAYPFVPATNIKINIGDSWKDVSELKINIGDAWKAVSKVQINIGDAWKTVFG